jgi:hypothetical protein
MDVHGWRDKVSQSVEFRISAHLVGKAFPSGLLRAALRLPAGTPPQRPRRHSQACRETESAYPAARASHRPRLLQTLSGASPGRPGPAGKYPPVPPFQTGQIACGIAWWRVPSPTVCLRLSATPLLGAEVPPRLP